MVRTVNGLIYDTAKAICVASFIPAPRMDSDPFPSDVLFAGYGFQTAFSESIHVTLKDNWFVVFYRVALTEGSLSDIYLYQVTPDYAAAWLLFRGFLNEYDTYFGLTNA